MIDPITIEEVGSQATLLYLVDNKELYNKKTQKLWRQINKPYYYTWWLSLMAKPKSQNDK